MPHPPPPPLCTQLQFTIKGTNPLHTTEQWGLESIYNVSRMGLLPTLGVVVDEAKGVHRE